MHANKIVIISRADDTRLYNRSITALRRLYAEKLRILAFRRNAGPLRNDFLILFFYILSGTLILSSVRMFLRTSLTHRHRYILAALRSLSSQLTRQAL